MTLLSATYAVCSLAIWVTMIWALLSMRRGRRPERWSDPSSAKARAHPPEGNAVLIGAVAVLVIFFLVMAVALPAHSKTERSQQVTRDFQKLYPCPSTGKTTGACPTHVRDHVIPLACGGPDSVANMVWQTVDEGKRKDHWERECWRWWQP